jgi:hypothetical protein
MRLAVVSGRVVDDAVFWRNFAYPLEDALASLPDATLVAAPPFRSPTFRATRPAWLSAIRTMRKADAVFWIQLNLRPPWPMWALAYARPSANRAVFATDVFPDVVIDLPRYARAQRLAYLFVGNRIPALGMARANPTMRIEWLPFAFNAKVFRDQRLERDIYAFWLGRRYPPLHEALRKHCSERGLRYEFLEPPGRPIPLDELSHLAARSRYFVTLPPDVEDPIRTGGTSPLSLRYLEGVGAGCRLLGVSPRSGELELLLPEDAIVECTPDGSDLTAVLDQADADPEFESTAAAACRHAHAEHTCERRARHIHERLLTLRGKH